MSAFFPKAVIHEGHFRLSPNVRFRCKATVPKGAPPPGHFQQSLGILDENGERVRYNLDVDGNRARDYTELPYVDALPNE